MGAIFSQPPFGVPLPFGDGSPPFDDGFSVSLPSTGTVNIPATATWSAAGTANLSPDQITILLVQDSPLVPKPTSEVKTKFTKGQSQGTIPFIATQSGTFHLQVKGVGTPVKLGNEITIMDTSTSTFSTQSSTSSTPGSSPPSVDEHTSTPIQVTASASTPTLSTTPATSSASASGESSVSLGSDASSTAKNSVTAGGGALTATPSSMSSYLAPSVSIPTPTDPSLNKNQSNPNLFVILGTILGFLGILAAVLFYLWYRRRSAGRTSSRIAFDKDMVNPSPWRTSSHFTLEKEPRSVFHTQLGNDALDTNTITPSDSVSQIWTKQKLFEKRRPLRESSDLTVITEK